MEVLSHSFDDGDTAFPAHGSSRGPFSPSLGAPSVASEGAPGATCQAGPTRAVLECFAGQAQLASALIKQGYFSCDLILTWLDQQKVAGVMICVPKHELEQLTAAFVYSVIMGCVVRDFPLILEGSTSSPFWKGLEQLPQEQRPHHRVEFEWRHWGAPALGRALAISNMPEITTVRREASPPTPRVALPSTSLAGYPVAFATALAEVFISGLTARQLPCLNPARINKAARVAGCNNRGVLWLRSCRSGSLWFTFFCPAQQ